MGVALGPIAGHLNRQLLDGPPFVGHVDLLLGRSISTQFLLANPYVIALRPLVDSLSVSNAGGPVRLAAQGAHDALTDGDSDSIVLRISDVGAVIAAALAGVAPERVAQTPNSSKASGS